MVRILTGRAPCLVVALVCLAEMVGGPGGAEAQGHGDELRREGQEARGDRGEEQVRGPLVNPSTCHGGSRSFALSQLCLSYVGLTVCRS